MCKYSNLVQNDIPTVISKLTTSNSVTEEGKGHLSENEEEPICQ